MIAPLRWLSPQTICGLGHRVIWHVAGLTPRDQYEERRISMSHETKLEPWQWPEEQWRKLVDQVRAGRAYRPQQWKGGARCAIALSFDSDHETNELRDGGKSI